MQRFVPPAGSVSVLAALVLTGCGDAQSPHDDRLPQIEIEAGTVTVSGLSAGGYMAVQFHVAYSGIVNGAGVIAAGPYYCAESSLRLALGRCMRGGDSIPTDELVTLTSELALEGQIDPISDLVEDRVWLLHGAGDDVVAKSVVDALDGYYQTLVDPVLVARIEHPIAAHTFPTIGTGGACATTESPFVAGCDYDAAGLMLQHLYEGLAARGDAHDGRLLQFDQHPYADAGSSSAFADLGWVYVPATCDERAATCRLHVVFHGCRQGKSFVGDRFVRESGYLEWAATNRLVVLFPQIEPSTQPVNPNGCWDWWGYEDSRYAVQSGPQMLAVRSMIADLRGEAPR